MTAHSQPHLAETQKRVAAVIFLPLPSSSCVTVQPRSSTAHTLQVDILGKVKIHADTLHRANGPVKSNHV